MKGFGQKDKYQNQKINKFKNELSKKEIMQRAFILHSKGKIKEAAKYYQYFINKGFRDGNVFSNYGTILRSLKKLKEAEIFLRKAIEIDPDFAMAYSNMGNVLKELGKVEEAEIFLRKAIKLNPKLAVAYFNLGNIIKDLGKLEEAEIFLRKAIKLNPNFARAYYSFSTLKNSNENIPCYKYLFSKDILKSKNDLEKIDIFFARSNILHIQRKYIESSKLLQKANNLKIKLRPFNPEYLIKKSKNLLIESNKQVINSNQFGNNHENIFIVGMPRSGTTLVESIISMNKNVMDLGETNILEESFLESKNVSIKMSLAEIYANKINRFNSKFPITTNKWLYNYLYAGIIANQLPNSKIIYCFRNPLDNILSIYRAHFGFGNEYSSSLKDCANVFLDHEEIIDIYIKQYPSKIYNLNYDLLVTSPNQQIKLLVNWLGWKWDNIYLKPHKNQRSVSTASNVQIRSPINSKSIGGWRNYKNMLEPAIEILKKTEKYQNLTD